MLGNCTNLLNALEHGRSSLSRKHCKIRQEAGPCFSTAAARRNTERILLFPDTASLLFWLVTYISNVPWMMLLKTCSYADYQSDSARCDLKIRLNSSCLNKILSKCLESEPSQFLSVKPQFYSQESFCLWSRVMLTGEASKGKGGASSHPVGCVLPGIDNFIYLICLESTCFFAFCAAHSQAVVPAFDILLLGTVFSILQRNKRC